MAKANLSSMSVDALIKLRDDVNATLSRKAVELKAQLRKLGGGVADNGSVKRRANGRKVAPKYRSRKDPKLTWAGRGATPLWMREEMKGTKLKKENFLIR
jgi:DNA-binding protein H-NS